MSVRANNTIRGSTLDTQIQPIELMPEPLEWSPSNNDILAFLIKPYYNYSILSYSIKTINLQNANPEDAKLP
jgi:hypothetical protein